MIDHGLRHAILDQFCIEVKLLELRNGFHGLTWRSRGIGKTHSERSKQEERSNKTLCHAEFLYVKGRGMGDAGRGT
jgi:hypothetical protein